MIFIFEDYKDDINSQFFEQGYTKEISDKFIYANGNGELSKVAEDKLKNTTEDIVVYLDVIPGNRSIFQVYKKLERLSKQYSYRLIVLPLVCAEYYIIKSLYNSQAMVDKTGVDICINKDVYIGSPLIKTSDDVKFCKNYEKYCKLILIKNLRECAKHTGKFDDNGQIRPEYGRYYLEDCKCNLAENICNPEINYEKVARLLIEYPCVPGGNNIPSLIIKKLSINEVWDIHRKLVDEYNSMVNHYIQKLGTANKTYKTIRPIK